MCIAIYKDSSASPVDKDTLKRCWTRNSDGAGYAWYDKKKKVWNVRKGFMTWEAFWNSFNEHQFQKKDVYMAHFRIGTSGNKRGPDCTHPFPVVGDCEVMRKTEFSSARIVMHNGVHGGGDGTISDTMLAVRNWIWFLWPLLTDKERAEYAIDTLQDGLRTTSNRWIITDGPEVTLYGTWIKDETTGVRYSNSGYEEPKTALTDNDYYRQRYNDRIGKSELPPAKTKDGIIRCWSADSRDKYLIQNTWDWVSWEDDFENHFEEHIIMIEGKDRAKKSTTEDTTEVQSGLVSPNVPATGKELPITVMGLVDENGDIDWDDDYAPEEDLLICPHCKNADYIVDPDSVRHLNTRAADSLCVQCGCMFMDDTGQIVDWDVSAKGAQDDASTSG